MTHNVGEEANNNDPVQDSEHEIGQKMLHIYDRFPQFVHQKFVRVTTQEVGTEAS